MPSAGHLLCVGSGLTPTGGVLESRSGFSVTTLRAPDRDLSSLSGTPIDCIVSELDLPDGAVDGIEFCRAVRERYPSVPFVLVVDPADAERTTDAIEAGVTDFHVRSSGAETAAVLADRVELVVSRGPDDATTDERPITDASRPETDARDRSADPDPTAPIAIDRFRPVIDHIADPVYVLDDAGICVAVNEALEEYAGYDRDHIEGRHVSDFLDETEYETAETTLEELYERGGTAAFDVTLETPDGETRLGEARVTVVTDDAGEYTGSIGVVRDITARRERVRELGRYEAIVKTAPIGLLVVDENGHIRWHNDEFTDDLGISGRDLVGTEFTALADEGFFPDATLENYLERVRYLLSSDNDDEQVCYEERWVDADGNEGVTEVNMGLLPLEDGEFAGTVYAFRNVTERVQYQDELERQNERLEKFASLVSHDLRNPLNVAQGHLDLLETKCDNEAVEKTRWAIDRMEELIDDLLALAQYGRTVADRERIELADLAEIAWRGVDTADATLVVDLDGEITGHKGRVRELLENLYRNSVEHGGDDVTVTVGQLASDGETSQGFYVEDDGSGLPETEDIFEFGHTTADDGTGFGLGIVSEIAEAHGWHVRACDAPTGGARFEIRGVTLCGSESVPNENP